MGVEPPERMEHASRVDDLAEKWAALARLVHGSSAVRAAPACSVLRRSAGAPFPSGWCCTLLCLPRRVGVGRQEGKGKCLAVRASAGEVKVHPADLIPHRVLGAQERLNASFEGHQLRTAGNLNVAPQTFEDLHGKDFASDHRRRRFDERPGTWGIESAASRVRSSRSGSAHTAS